MKDAVRSVKLEVPGRLRLATGEEMGFLLVMRGSAHVDGLWSMGPDQLLLCRPGRALELEYAGGKIPLSALWVRLSLEKIAACSTEETDLLAGFAVNPAPVVAARVNSDTLMLIKSLATQLMRPTDEGDSYAADVMEHATVQMFLALVLHAFATQDPHRARQAASRGGQLSLDEVFRYIHTHLTEELTLETLEKEFYVSRSHLIRLFKKRTGQTVHRYIVQARLDLCREYLAQGYSVTEVYRMGGFGGYNHFFKAFRQEYGMTPKEYCRSLQEQERDRP